MELISKISFGLLNGAVWGSILALLSSGLNVVFGLMGTVNVAHGSFYMFGAFLSLLVFESLGTFWPSLAISPLAVGLLGVLVGVVIRPVREKSLVAVMITFGAMLTLQGSALLIWGGRPRRLPLPFVESFSVFGSGYSYYRLLVAAISGLVLFLLWLLLERSNLGILLRAAREDNELSQSIGIPVQTVNLIGFGLGGGLAGLSGALVAPLVSLTPDMGLRIFATVFLIVILGGLGRVWRATLVAFIFATTRGLATAFLDPTKGLILTFFIAILVILIESETGKWS
jgi:branched-chain amino acid transport system permease protein